MNYGAGATLVLTHVTVADNTASFGGGAISNTGTVTVGSTVIEGECVSSGGLISNGYNIESPGETCGFDRATDQVDVTNEELNLGPLADNGGPTKTHSLRLMPESAAIDAIPEEQCLDSNGNPLVADQRGQPRPETGGARCDVGAFELERGGP